MGLGLHGGGVGSAEFFSRLGSRVVVTDLKAERELRPSTAKLRRFTNIVYHLGGHQKADFKSADCIIKGPGVPENSKFLQIAKRSRVPVLSDAEVFFIACPAPIIGITGTKGKSTTTWLIGRFLQKGLKTRIWIGGNIRRSMLEFLPHIKKVDIVVLELSSFQLDSLKNQKKSPHIALVTNVFPDHLNRYPSMAAYAASKANIFKFQKGGDVLFINGRDRLLRRLARQAPGRIIRFDPKRIIHGYSGALSEHVPDFHFPNIAAAIAVARYMKVGERAIRNALKRFHGMPGRMQLIRKIGGAEFINDTTATNPEAAEHAVVAIKRRIGRRRLVVIAGGYDKGLPVGNFVRALQAKASAVVFLPGTATRKMKSKIRNAKFEIVDAKTMKEAVRFAHRAARPTGTVLLSPGAASFGLFKHEFDRGEQFAQAVQALSAMPLTESNNQYTA